MDVVAGFRDPIRFDGLEGFWSYRLLGERFAEPGDYYLDDSSDGSQMIGVRATAFIRQRQVIIEPMREFVWREKQGWALAKQSFPRPRCKVGEQPCGECHIQQGETCDICGAK